MEIVRKMARRKVVWHIVMGIAIAQSFIGSGIHRALAAHLYQASSTPPSGVGGFSYVVDSWGNAGYSCGGGSHRQSFCKGYNVNVSGQFWYFVLDFGRQDYFPSGNWGIWTYDQPHNIKHSMAWVTTVANDFIKGYNQSHNHPMIVAIGTNNGNEPWTSSDTKWSTAGSQWGSLVAGLPPGNWVTVWSANDIEGWYDDGQRPAPTPTVPRWWTTGTATLNWFSGYTSVTNIWNLNFGDNVYREIGAPTWTIDQQYQVAVGAAQRALIMPEVYCDYAFYTTSWQTVVPGHAMAFLGVTTDDHQSRGCPGNTYTLPWATAWSKFNDVIQTPEPGWGLQNNAIRPVR